MILEAAARVFATHLPDAVGLKDIAREAGVSHALVTHYFGTYQALVEATLERQIDKAREGLVDVVMRLMSEEADAKAILAAHRSAIVKAAADPATARLGTWAMLSGRASAVDFFPHRVQGLKLLADAVSARSTASRDDIEFLLISSFSFALVSAFGRRALAGALGRRPTREYEEDFERKIDELLGGYLHAAERRAKLTDRS